MTANYCRVIKQQAEELKHVTVFIMKLTFDQNAGNVTGTLHIDQRGVWSHHKVLICHTHLVGPKPCNKDIIQTDGTKTTITAHLISHSAICCPLYKFIHLVRETKQYDISSYSSDRSPCKPASSAASLPDRQIWPGTEQKGQEIPLPHRHGTLATES